MMCRGTHFIILHILILFIFCSIGSSRDARADDAYIGVETFKGRRQALMDSLGEGTAVLYSQGRDSETGYRADGNFWYLTGIDEKEAILILSPRAFYREVVLLPPRNPEDERWSGWLPELTDSLRQAWGVDEIRRTGDVNRLVVERMKQTPILHLISSLASPDEPIPPDLELYNEVSARIPGVTIQNSSRFLETMRMIKSAAEIAAIEEAIAVTARAMTDVLAAVRPGVTEYQLEAVLETSIKQQGTQHMAFPAIIAAGGNTHFLHYQKRHDTLKTGQLLLMDIGASWNRYSADITRTFPIDGRFTAEQAEVYDVVLAAHTAALAQIKPGATTYEVHEAVEAVFRRAGYIDDYWHWTGHHLGLNTHDLSDDNRPFAPGMVITVEPGIYLPDLQFGIRIEDDILVTESGYRVLSAGIPRERNEVEAWISSARK